MKNIKIFLIATILFVLNTNAQPNQEKKGKIKALKVAFITNELSLTSDEAIKFWPVFNVFEAKQQEIRGTKTKSLINRMSDEDLEKMSDKEAINLMNQLENTEEELFQNRKKLVTNLRGILSPIKLLKLKRAEDNFSKKLLQQYRNKD